jgi:hypothetical protein
MYVNKSVIEKIMEDLKCKRRPAFHERRRGECDSGF